MEHIILGALELGFIYALMALGLFISYRVLDVADLTVDGSFTTGAAVSAICTVSGHPILGLLLAIPAGAVAGLITSLLQTKLKVQPILAGILTMLFLYSVNIRIMGNKSNLPLLRHDTIFTPLSGKLAPLFFIIALVLVVCLALILFLQTKTGLSVRATGDNIHMVSSSSINPHLTNAIALALANGLVALSGGLLAQYQQSADISMGVGIVVIGLASVIIGEIVLGTTTIHRHILAVVVGSILYRLFMAMALKSASANDLKAISAMIVCVAISYPAIKEMIRVRKMKKEGLKNG